MITFIKSATKVDEYPPNSNIEICFVGRSNVGKSSLINAVSNQKIAFSSKAPGRTRLINFFNYNNNILVDLPGYGFSKMSKTMQVQLGKMMEEYFNFKRETLVVFLLIDSKIGPTKDDIKMLDYLNFNNIKFFIVLTKVDKVNQSQKHTSKEKIEKWTKDFLFVSSKNNTNINKLKNIILSIFKNNL